MIRLLTAALVLLGALAAAGVTTGGATSDRIACGVERWTAKTPAGSAAAAPSADDEPKVPGHAPPAVGLGSKPPAPRKASTGRRDEIDGERKRIVGSEHGALAPQRVQLRILELSGDLAADPLLLLRIPRSESVLRTQDVRGGDEDGPAAWLDRGCESGGRIEKVGHDHPDPECGAQAPVPL
jgi:hypothetical protein